MRARFMLAILSLGVPLQAGDWPHWRGPQRNDHSDESSGFQNGQWTINEVWRESVGEGSSSPVVAEGRLYALGWREGQEVVSCLDAGAGKSLWNRAYSAPQYGRLARGDEGLYSGPSSTPEFDEATGRLFTLGVDGDLRCWDTRADGEPVWQKNLYADYQIPVRPKVGRSGHRDYGYTSSPLLLGDQLIVEVGSPASGNLMGFDPSTGRELWRSADKSPAGHNGGPVPITVEGVPCVAVHNFEELLVARIDSGHQGETVATFPWRTDFGNNIATPAVLENNVLVTSSYNHHQIVRLRITLEKGAEPVWSAAEASKVCSPLIVDGSVYWAWHELLRLDFETGKVLARTGQFGDPGSVIATADNRLIIWSANGNLALYQIPKRPDEPFQELAVHRNIGRGDAWPHVVLAQRRLYCKDRSGQIVCEQIE
jgi:outer membrane protein assembly factor BamB